MMTIYQNSFWCTMDKPLSFALEYSNVPELSVCRLSPLLAEASELKPVKKKRSGKKWRSANAKKAITFQITSPRSRRSTREVGDDEDDD